MRCICVNGSDELSDHEERWGDLRRKCGGTIYASYEFSKLWLEAFGSTAAARVLLVEEAGDLVGVAPLTIQRRHIAGVPIRTLQLVGNSRGELGFSPVMILADPGNPGVIDAILEQVRELDWNVLRTAFMEETESTRQYAGRVRSQWGRCQQSSSTLVVRDLPEDGEVSGCFGKTTRKTLFHKIRLLERETGFEFRAIPIDGIDRAVDTYARQHVERWAAKGGSFFRDPRNAQFMKLIMGSSLSNGFGYAYELLIDAEVAAQAFGFVEGDRAWAFRAGMNEAFAGHSPGLIMSYLVMSALRSAGIRSMSMGAGSEAHKLRSGGRQEALIDLHVQRGLVPLLSMAARSPPGRVLRSALGVMNGSFDSTDG